jgi:quercetin dioxygenase-like cupin family protein
MPKSKQPTQPRHLRWNEDEIQAEQLTPLIRRQYFSTPGMTVARFELKKGCQVTRHQHANEQVSYIISGALKFIFDDREIVVRGGEALYIPPNVPHAAEALQDTLNFDVFSPARADWLNRKDTYLREVLPMKNR